MPNQPSCPECGATLKRGEPATWAHSGSWECPNGDHLAGDEFCLDCGEPNDSVDDEVCRRCSYERKVDAAEAYRG